MGGQVLDYEAKRILNKGIEEGMREGIKEGIKEGMSIKETEFIKNMLINKINISVIMDVTNMPKEMIENIREELIKQGKIKENKKVLNKGKTR